VDYFEYTHTDSLQIEYSGPDTNDEWMIVPSSALKSNLVIATEPTVTSKLVVSVFPNPAPQHNINIQVESILRDQVTVRLYDAFGREIIADEFAMDEVREGVKLSLQNRLNNGIYIIHVRQGGDLVQKKIFIRDK